VDTREKDPKTNKITLEAIQEMKWPTNSKRRMEG
jgi:hypothetical protein